MNIVIGNSFNLTWKEWRNCRITDTLCVCIAFKWCFIYWMKFYVRVFVNSENFAHVLFCFFLCFLFIISQFVKNRLFKRIKSINSRLNFNYAHSQTHHSSPFCSLYVCDSSPILYEWRIVIKIKRWMHTSLKIF